MKLSYGKREIRPAEGSAIHSEMKGIQQIPSMTNMCQCHPSQDLALFLHVCLGVNLFGFTDTDS